MAASLVADFATTRAAPLLAGRTRAASVSKPTPQRSPAAAASRRQGRNLSRPTAGPKSMTIKASSNSPAGAVAAAPSTPSSSSSLPYSKFNDGTDTPIAPLLNGCWTLAGGHGPINPAEIVSVMQQHAERGLTTFDTADIYGPSEKVLGVFQEKWAAEHASAGAGLAGAGGEAAGGAEGGAQAAQKGDGSVQIFTKFVPNIFYNSPTRAFVRQSIQKSLAALRLRQLDLVQLHWWDYSVPGLMDVASHLAELREEGLIKSIGVTNMNLATLKEMVAGGIPVVCNQVQFSLLDTRPLDSGMVDFCKQHDIKLFTYGTLAGGLLSDRYHAEPKPGLFGKTSYGKTPDLNTSSLKMYWRIVREAGGEGHWRQLLQACSEIAAKHNVSIADVALRWAMDQGPVHPIVGMRNSSHIDDNLRVLSFSLDDEDHSKLKKVQGLAKGPRGDCYDMERGS